MIYLSLFENNDKYQEVKDKLPYPSVSYLEDSFDVKYSDNYYAVAWKDGDPSPTSIEESGCKGLAADWDFFLIDTTLNTGLRNKPVGKLMKTNLLRFIDGSFAPTVGITEEMRKECDVELYLDKQHSIRYCEAGMFNPTAFYNEYGISQKLYKSDGSEVRVLRPWETTETKYTIGLGRDKTVYLLDNKIGTSGKSWRGIFLQPVVWDGIDVSKFPLVPTAISPGPVCTVGGKTRNFFYLYEGEQNCKSSKGIGDLCTIFLNGRTYPRVNDMQQVSNMNYARANNSDPNNPYPFAEGGYHALNTFIVSQEILYGTKYLHSNSLFGSGISSNDPCNNESTWKSNGGLRYHKVGESEWKYSGWNGSGDIYYMDKENPTRNSFTVFINQEYPKEQCMESQMAVSYAMELGIPEGQEFEFYDGTYWYTKVNGGYNYIEGDVMNFKVYKKIVGTVSAYDSAGTPTDWNIEIILRMSLIGGANLSGDVFTYWGGGYEQVGTCTDPKSGSTGNPVDLYLQPDQSKWVKETTFTKNDLGKFDFESTYMKMSSTTNEGSDEAALLNEENEIMTLPLVDGKDTNLGDGYASSRISYTPWKSGKGGGLGTGECFYTWDNNYWSSVLNQRVRIAARFRGSANYGFCSPRFLLAHYASSDAFRFSSGSAQVLLGEDEPAASGI